MSVMRNPSLFIRRSQVAINMTPMIDVTFLLIIFFLVSSHLSKQENHVKLDLPEADHALAADIVAAEKTVTINYLDNGVLRLGAAEITLEQLSMVLSQMNRDAAGKLQVRLRCSANTAYGRVSPLLRQLIQANITDVVFAVYDSKRD